jgi:4-aminobutyrate aminotransferase
MSRWLPGSHGGTYGGNALAAAAACATIDVMSDENLPGNAACTGVRLVDGLKGLQAQYPVIGDVRGRGLMIGVEFTHEGQPDVAAAALAQKTCLEQHLLLLTCGTYGNVIRWIPPLIVSDTEIDEALDIFAQALAQTQQTPVTA